MPVPFIHTAQRPINSSSLPGTQSTTRFTPPPSAFRPGRALLHAQGTQRRRQGLCPVLSIFTLRRSSSARLRAVRSGSSSGLHSHSLPVDGWTRVTAISCAQRLYLPFSASTSRCVLDLSRSFVCVNVVVCFFTVEPPSKTSGVTLLRVFTCTTEPR